MASENFQLVEPESGVRDFVQSIAELAAAELHLSTPRVHFYKTWDGTGEFWTKLERFEYVPAFCDMREHFIAIRKDIHSGLLAHYVAHECFHLTRELDESVTCQWATDFERRHFGEIYRLLLLHPFEHQTSGFFGRRSCDSCGR